MTNINMPDFCPAILLFVVKSISNNRSLSLLLDQVFAGSTNQDVLQFATLRYTWLSSYPDLLSTSKDPCLSLMLDQVFARFRN